MLKFPFRRTAGPCLLILSIVVGAGSSQTGATPLDDYVAAPDPSYHWERVLTTYDPAAAVTGHVLDMTSQTWRSPEEVNRTEWQHYVTVAVPDVRVSDRAILIIEGGSNSSTPPTSMEPLVLTAASGLQSIVVYLQQVPNQPLQFDENEDGLFNDGQRSEDALIAYSWYKAINTLDATWAAQLPMTKSAVRAMDAAQEFLATPEGGSITISDFLVGGASKRGWTTWLTAAVDTRVSAIAPLVIDALNVMESFEHHWNSLGFWSSAVDDYTNMGIMNYMRDPRLSALMSYIDPYVYRDRYTMPKFLVNACGDQFFLSESSQFYWNDLIGEKYLRYIPNTDHGMTGMGFVEALGSLVGYLQAKLSNTPLPQFSWTLEPDGSIRVQTVDTPTEVLLWQATNPNARDFRLEEIGAAWTSSPLSDQGGGVYVGQVPTPSSGFTAFMVELRFDGLKFSTQIRVLPEPIRLKLDYTQWWGNVEVVSVPYSPTLYYYDPNTIVTLTAVPDSDDRFENWVIHDPQHPNDPNYDVVDTNNPLTVEMSTNRYVTAVFGCGTGSGLAMFMVMISLMGMRLMRHRP